MRDLVQYIQESFNTPPSHPPKDAGDFIKTGHVVYGSEREDEPTHRFAPGYSGTSHTVAWDTSHRNGTKEENNQMLHDALHSHRHYIENKTNVGDVVKNTPTKSKDGDDKRARIYKKVGGFGSAKKHDDKDAGISDRVQHGIVRQHPDDHPDEEKRGKKYLHPLEHNDIETHEAASKPKPRIIR